MPDRHTTDRTDDADARGEHEYRPGQPKGGADPTPGPSVHREPNTYAAGEHGTQQVTTRPAANAADPKEKKDSETIS